MKELVGFDMSARSTFQVLWEPRDLWVGVYWTTCSKIVGDTLDIYICLLPCLPIKLQWFWLAKDFRCT